MTKEKITPASRNSRSEEVERRAKFLAVRFASWKLSGSLALGSCPPGWRQIVTSPALGTWLLGATVDQSAADRLHSRKSLPARACADAAATSSAYLGTQTRIQVSAYSCCPCLVQLFPDVMNAPCRSGSGFPSFKSFPFTFFSVLSSIVTVRRCWRLFGASSPWACTLPSLGQSRHNI